MSEEAPKPSLAPRSPLLMNADDTALLVIDVQEKLLPHIRGHERIVFNLTRLIRGASALGVRTEVTERYPKGLGYTVAAVGELTGSPAPEKLMFSCRECGALMESLRESGCHRVLLAGIETHVCVAQTAFDFIAAGFDCYLCLDAIGSRFEIDHETAIRRMELAGVTPTTTEAALFEWCETAGTPEFKTISKLAQETM